MDLDVPVLPRINDYVGYWAEVAPLRVAFALDETRTIYGELADEIAMLAKALLGFGVVPGDRVAVLGDAQPDAIALFLAAASIGAVFQGLNPKHRHAELTYQLADAQPVVLISVLDDPTSRPIVERLGAELPSIRRTFTAGPRDIIATAGTVADATLTAATKQVATEMPAALVYTSGSTGRPKGALLPHRGFTWPSVVQSRHWFDGEPGSIICNLPIDHVGAIGNICSTSLVAGGTIVFQRQFDAAGVLDLIEAERVTYWGAVPAMFQLSVATARWRTADLSSLRKIIWSGGAASPALIEALHERCLNLVTSYGLTETVGDVTFSDPADDAQTLSSTIGRPERSYEVRLAREDGSTCDEGEDGEIVVRGDFIMRGYHNRAAATQAAIDTDGWLHTGDLARLRPDGNYQLVGRKSEMYKSGGYNVYPREVELAIEEHPAVQLAAVVGVPDDVYGYVGHAYVLADPSRLSADELRRFATERLANYKLPKQYTVTTDLPMLPIGKIDKTALKPDRR